MANLQSTRVSTTIPGRLLYVVNHSFPYSSNGYAVRTHGIATALANKGYSVIVVNRPGMPWDFPGYSSQEALSSKIIDGVRYLFLRQPSSKAMSWDEYLSAAKNALLEVLRVFKPGAVMAASNWENALPARDAAKDAGLPFFYEVRGFWEISKLSREPGYEKSDDFKHRVRMETQVALSAQSVFTLNRFMKDELIRRGVDADKIDLVPNALGKAPVASAPSQTVRKHLGITSKRVVGYIGSFTPYEGLEDLIVACARLRKKGVDLSLLLVGSSHPTGILDDEASCPVCRAFRNLANQHGFENNLILHGRVPHDAVGDYYALIDLVVIPRKPMPVCELVSPMKLLEAVAYGKCLLTSDVAPLAEFAQNAGTHLFKKGLASDLQDQIERLIGNDKTKNKADARQVNINTASTAYDFNISPIVTKLKGFASNDVASVSIYKTNEVKADELEQVSIVWNPSDIPLKEKYLLFVLPKEKEINTSLHHQLEDLANNIHVPMFVVCSSVCNVRLEIDTNKRQPNYIQNSDYSLDGLAFNDLDKEKLTIIYNCPARKQFLYECSKDERVEDILDILTGICLNNNHCGYLQYWVMLNEANIKSGYSKRTFRLSRSLQEILSVEGWHFRLLTRHLGCFKKDDQFLSIPNSKELLHIVLSLSTPTHVIAASNHQNAMIFGESKTFYDYHFTYEMRGVWHESYAARKEYASQQQNTTFLKHKDKFYLKELQNEVSVHSMADLVSYICEELASYMRSHKKVFVPNYLILNNAIELQHIQSSKVRNNKSENKLVLGYLGSIAEYEGLDMLIDAVKEIRDELHLDIQIILAGNTTKTFTTISSMLNRSYVKYLGYIAGDEIEAFYEQIDLYVIPRLPYTVSQVVSPLKPYEVMSRGIPLLMSDCAPLARIAKNGAYAALFKAGNADSLKEMIINIAKNGFNKDIIYNARHHIENLATWDKIAEKLFTRLKNARIKQKVYIAYADKWWISKSWGGATVNTIKEMCYLSQNFDVYFNNTYCSDLLKNGTIDENALRERICSVIKQPDISCDLNKMIFQNKRYVASFHRTSSSENSTKHYVQLQSPRIFGHNYVESVWGSDINIVGFQTSTATTYAREKMLGSFDDDGTLNYTNPMLSPRRTFLRIQGLESTPSLNNIIKHRAMIASNEVNVAIIGTIYIGTDPNTLIACIEKMRKEYDVNIQLIFFSEKKLENIHKAEWIRFDSFNAHNKDMKFSKIDLIVNTWNKQAAIYSGSNKNIDAVTQLIPIVLPKTSSYVEQLGEDYPLYIPTNSKQSSLYELADLISTLKIALDPKIRLLAVKKLLLRQHALSLNNTAHFYKQQIQSLYPNKILIINPSASVGGVQKYSYMIAQSLAFSKVTIAVPEFTDNLNNICTTGIIPANTNFATIQTIIEDQTQQFDAVYFNSYPTDKNQLDLLMDSIAVNNSKKYAIVHSDIHPFIQTIANRINRFTRIYYVSELCKNKLLQHYQRYNGKHKLPLFTLLQPSFEEQENSSSSAVNQPIASTLNNSRTFHLSYLGRGGIIKGVIFLARMFANYCNIYPNTKLSLSINGPVDKQCLKSIESITSQCSQITLNDRTFSKPEVEEIFKKSDALINCSILEGLPYTFLEAIQNNLPIITTTPGGISKFFEKSDAALLIDTSNVIIEDINESNPYSKLVALAEEKFEQINGNFIKALYQFETDQELFLRMKNGAKLLSFPDHSYSCFSNKIFESLLADSGARI